MTRDDKAEQTSGGVGALRNDQNALMFGEGFSFSGYERNVAFLNRGNGTFLDISGISGADAIADSRASVFADFDNDGDLDIFVTAIQGAAHLLYRNNVGQDREWLRVVLEGDRATGLDAVGAVARIQTASGVQTRIKSGGAGFLSQHDGRQHFSVGAGDRVTAIHVTWPDGGVERFSGDAHAGSTIVLTRGRGVMQAVPVGHTRLPDPLTTDQVALTRLAVRPGAPFPALELHAAGPDPRPLSSYLRPGRRLLVNVWASWCGPCAKEMPELQTMRDALAARGIDLLGVNVDTDDVDLEGYLRRLGITYDTAAGGASAIKQLYAGDEVVVPISFLVDDTGNLLEVIPGWSAATQKRFGQLVEGTR